MNADIVMQALRTVEDPEAGMNVVDLGLVYDVKVGADRVNVEMTMTSPSCPMAPYIVDEATAAVRGVLPDGFEAEVSLVWDPPWTPERMSQAARDRFGWKD